MRAGLDRLQREAESFEDAVRVPGWQGAASTAAATAARTIADEGREEVADLARLYRALGEASDDVRGIERGVRTVQDSAHVAQVRIGADGTVTDARPPQTFSTAADAAADHKERQQTVDGIVDHMKALLARAAAVDATLTAALAAVAGRARSAGDATSLQQARSNGASLASPASPAPPAGASPAANAGWWVSLSDTDRHALITQRPDTIGNLDGIPAAVRDQANRARIPALRAKAEAELHRLDVTRITMGRQGLSTEDVEREMDRVREQLASLRAVDDTLNRDDRHLLSLDLTGERVRAAVAVGDVDTADNVAVFTPGTRTSVSNSLMGYDDQMRQLHAKAKSADPTRTTAVVTWIGYEAPQLHLDNGLGDAPPRPSTTWPSTTTRSPVPGPPSGERPPSRASCAASTPPARAIRT